MMAPSPTVTPLRTVTPKPIQTRSSITIGADPTLVQSSRSKQSGFPFIRDVTVDVIASAGNKLWKELVASLDPTIPMRITNVQLAFTGLENAEPGQSSIEGFFKSDAQRLETVKRSRYSEERDAEQSHSPVS